MEKGLRILELDITNTRKVKAFNKILGGGNMHIAGTVGSGKTTATNAIWEIIKKNPDTVTHGERKGIIIIKLGDGSGREVIAKRVTTLKSSTITIADEKGKSISKGDFDAMISTLAVNPHKIKGMLPTERVASLMRSAKVKVDVVKLDEDIASNEAKRLEAGRDAKNSKPTGDKPEKVEAVDVSALVDELDKAEQVNAKNNEHRNALEVLRGEKVSIAGEIETISEQVAELQRQLGKLAPQLKETEERIVKGVEYVKTLTEADTGAIKVKMASAQTTNNAATAYQLWVNENNHHQTCEKEHQKYTDEVSKLQDDKKAALESAEWPIDGLSISDGEIYYDNGVDGNSRFGNLGDSEQILVCSALAMNDILAHDIRVVRLDGVESMSQNHLDKLVAMFNGHNIQVLTTRVARGDIGPEEIEIIDGEYSEATK